MADMPRDETRDSAETSPGDRWYTVDDVIGKFHAEGLEISEPTVYRLVAAGRFPGVKLGRLIRLRRNPVDAFLDEAKTTNTLIDIATWQPHADPTPAPALLPQVPGSRADGEGVA